MSKNSKVLAAELLRIKLAFTDREIEDAIRLLESSELSSLFDLRGSKDTSTRTQRTQSSSRSSYEFATARHMDPDDPRHDKLASFEEFLIEQRHGVALEDIRKLGERLDKEFRSGKSKRDTVPKLILILSKLDKDVMYRIVDEFLAKHIDPSGDYGRLAKFLIGKS